MFNFLILNPTFDTDKGLPPYESIIWTERYNSYSSFELGYRFGAIADSTVTDLLGKMIYFEKTDKIMIIETVDVNDKDEDGYEVLYTGRSLESILTYRRIQGTVTLSGNIQDVVLKLLNENFISPINTARKIDNFIFKRSSDTRFDDVIIDEGSYTGNSVYDIIQSICSLKKIGFKIYIDTEDHINYTMVFELFIGVDRSEKQILTPVIEYSVNNGTAIGLNFYCSKENYYTDVFIQGSTITHTTGQEKTGLDRREAYLDAWDINTTTELTERGTEYLNDNKELEIYDVEANTDSIYKYGESYFLGDLVSVPQMMGSGTIVRVTEFIYSDDDSGITEYPTLVTEEDEVTE